MSAPSPTIMTRERQRNQSGIGTFTMTQPHPEHIPALLAGVYDPRNQEIQK
jgi:hypothetical protein